MLGLGSGSSNYLTGALVVVWFYTSENDRSSDMLNSFLLLLVTSATLVVTGALLVVTKSY